MKRSPERHIGPMRWLLGAAITAGLLVAVFSLVTPDLLEGEWPLGIKAREVSSYADLFDRRPHDTPTATPESYHIGASHKDGACLLDHTGPGWTQRWFEADGYGDSVQVRRLRTEEGGFIIKFDREEPFHAQRQIVLIPADVESIRAKYLEILATELGLVTPEVSFIRVIACGQDLGLFLKEERIGPEFMEKHRLADAALFEQGFDPGRPDQLSPVFESDTLAARTVRSTLQQVYADLLLGRTDGLPYIVDGEGAASWLLMRWLESDGDPYAEEGLFAYRWTTGRILPIYRRSRGSHEARPDTAAPILFNPMTAMLRAPTFRTAFTAQREKLIEESWKVKERFAAADAAWLPILARYTSLSAAQARAAAMSDELLRTRLNKDPLSALDRPMVFGPGHATLQRNDGPSRYWPGAGDDRPFPPANMGLKIIVRRDSVFFPRGSYAIDEDLIIPYGYTVVLEQGARFAIAAGRSVLCLGPLIVRGTPRNPVFVRPQQDDAPFGTFAVCCNAGERCSISGLLISGGSEARINGQYHSGMFSIRGASNTTLMNCVISGSAGEDALNIKGGSALLKDCVFEDGHADLVDLDFVTGDVRDCVFRSGREDSNGDGLDVSGSHVLVEGCRMERMMDKGLSSGEASQVLVRSNRFEGNRLAIASKDLSVVYVQDNTFTNNALVFGVYRKKPIYGGAHLMLGTNIYEGNAKERDVDALSEIVPQDSLKAEVLKAFGAR